MTGVILRHGYLVAEWGEPQRVDPTFSVTKSFLSSTVGLAFDHGLIRDLNEPVQQYVPTEHFESEHNARITWDHLLRQTSDWEGTLWAKPGWADRPPADQSLADCVKPRRHVDQRPRSGLVRAADPAPGSLARPPDPLRKVGEAGPHSNRLEPDYGFMNWFLNTGRRLFPSAPEASSAHLGAGTNMVSEDPHRDLVVEARWIQGAAADGLIRRVLAAVVE